MALDNKNVAIDKHLKELEGKRKQNSKKNIFLLSGGALLVSLVGFMSLGSPFGDAVATPDLPMEVWEVEEKPKSVLVSSETVITEEIVAVIKPTQEQMERLKLRKAGRKVIRENRKRAKKTDVKEIGLTHKEVILLENADILGGGNKIFKKSDLKTVEGKELPTRFNNAEIGISDETYSAEEVEDLHMVTTGYVQKVYNGDKK